MSEFKRLEHSIGQKLPSSSDTAGRSLAVAILEGTPLAAGRIARAISQREIRALD
ncbi:MAG TPA: hypothetical protein VJ975_03145 [Candidatus Limnocylindria bacterium]|nr:hypothetical protein [Candidatus Limnocylindria bacterium]